MGEDLRHFLASQFAEDCARAIEAMTSEKPRVALVDEGPMRDGRGEIWRQSFHATEGAAWMHAAETVWISLGARTLRAAGIDEYDDATAKSTFTEILGQTFSMLGRAVAGRTGMNWTCSEGASTSEWPDVPWKGIHLTFNDGTTEILHIGFDQALVEASGGAQPASVPAVAAERAPVPRVERSKTLDLLLDVELPVSVSFGRAQLPLKDVIKLTTGSIVELNRTVSEPVEVIVNNCVIARGEVVVVEGNFGVRIHQVVSREERLRTLY